MAMDDCDMQAVYANLCKAQKSWRMLSRLLHSENIEPRICGMFYKALTDSQMRCLRRSICARLTGWLKSIGQGGMRRRVSGAIQPPWMCLRRWASTPSTTISVCAEPLSPTISGTDPSINPAWRDSDYGNQQVPGIPGCQVCSAILGNIAKSLCNTRQYWEQTGVHRTGLVCPSPHSACGSLSPPRINL